MSWEVLTPRFERRLNLQWGQFHFCNCARPPNSRLSLFALCPLSPSCDGLAHSLDIIDAEPDLRKLRVIVDFIKGVCLGEKGGKSGCRWRPCCWSMVMRPIWAICAHDGRGKCFENGFVADTFDENNGTCLLGGCLVCHFWKSPGGETLLSRLAVARVPYPLSTSQSRIQIHTLTLRLPPQHSSSSNVRTSRTTLRLVRLSPARFRPVLVEISSPACRSTHKLAISHWLHC